MAPSHAAVHVSRDQNHLVWDPAIPAVATIGSGDIVELDCLDASFGQLTADSTNEEALRQLSVHEFDRAVIAIGSHIESSILTTSVVLGLGVPHVWAKAISHAHARILAQIGAHHVVRPEHDMGKRVAHLVGGRMMEYIEFEDGFAMAKTNPPNRLLGHPLGRTGVRSEHGVTVVAIKRPGLDFTYATAETVIEPGDTIIVSGATTEVEKFSELT